MALATSNKVTTPTYGPTLPKNPISFSLGSQPINLSSSSSNSVQTTTPATNKPGAINNIISGAVNAIKNPSQGGGLFQGAIPTAQAAQPTTVSKSVQTAQPTQATVPGSAQAAAAQQASDYAKYFGGQQNTQQPSQPAQQPSVAQPAQPAQPVQQAQPTSTGTPGYFQQILDQARQAATEAAQAKQNLSQAEVDVTKQGIALPFVTGQQQALERTYGTQVQAAQDKAKNLASIAGLAAPQLASYSQQAFNPVTGQFSGGGSLQDAVSGVVQKLQSGQMDYQTAVQTLSGYGQGGINALQAALPQGFNVAQSNALAQQQGTIGPAYSYAKSALSNLLNAVNNLGSGQNTNIPIINQITQGLSTQFGIGSTAVQAYKGALAEARSAIQKVLASVQGGTPTDYVGQSNALLPDNATPNQIQAALQTLETLGQAKVNIYGNPGQSGTQSSGTMFGSFF